jgi:hypothetical protein
VEGLALPQDGSIALVVNGVWLAVLCNVGWLRAANGNGAAQVTTTDVAARHRPQDKRAALSSFHGTCRLANATRRSQRGRGGF